MPPRKQSVEESSRGRLLTALNEDGATSHLVMAWKASPPNYRTRRVDTNADVAAHFLALARTTAEALSKSVKIDYDTEWPLKGHEHFVLEPDEQPATNLFRDLTDFLTLARMTRRSLTKPRLYIVAVQTESGTAFLGKRMVRLKILAKKKGVFAAVWDGDTFSKLDESVATFADDFDWVYWDDRLFVLNDAGFHAEFRDNDAVRDAVLQHVATITTSLTIKNEAKFAERCQSSVPMASKLAKVAQSGIWDRPLDELKAYGDSHSIDVVWDGDALVFDNEFESQWDILKLLDEDRTDGPVTGRQYESSAKRRLPEPDRD